MFHIANQLIHFGVKCFYDKIIDKMHIFHFNNESSFFKNFFYRNFMWMISCSYMPTNRKSI